MLVTASDILLLCHNDRIIKYFAHSTGLFRNKIQNLPKGTSTLSRIRNVCSGCIAGCAWSMCTKRFALHFPIWFLGFIENVEVCAHAISRLE